MRSILVVLLMGLISGCGDNNNRAEEKPQFKTFTENDFHFSKKELKHKETIIAGVNKVHREHPGCEVIHPSSASISSDKGTKKNPVFFVACGDENKGAIFNVWFSKSDVENSKKIEAIPHMASDKADKICKDHVLSKAEHPSTVDFSVLSNVIEHQNGNTTIERVFTAKNSFNLELKYSVRCLLNKDGLVQEPHITEEQS